MIADRKIPTLVDLCVRKAIDNLRDIGNVGYVDELLLERILPHCTVDQLMNIENATEGRDLSSVTNDLWKRFYEKQFGKESVENVIERMLNKKVTFKWKQLFDAKTKEREAFQNRLGEKLRKRYQEDKDKKQCRQVKFTKKEPPSSNKRFFPGSNSYKVAHLKSNIMKKAKLECITSNEARIHATIRRNDTQRKSLPPQNISRSAKPDNSHKTSSASSSKTSRPPGRRY